MTKEALGILRSAGVQNRAFTTIFTLPPPNFLGGQDFTLPFVVTLEALTPPATALAAAEAAGMPVRRPRRSAAVSAADAADADPPHQRRPEHERAAKPPIGEGRCLLVGLYVCAIESISRSSLVV